MKNAQTMLITLFIISTLFPAVSYTCTTFCFQNNGEWVYGRNYDWNTGHCLIIVNKRGVSKTALNAINPAKWVSKYGSVTFNQYGREFPLGGMNEAGLVIECMWLAQARYPQPDARTELSELQWIQYQLDNFATVNEVIASDKHIMIENGQSATLHFLVCDRKGNAAAIEFLDGKMKAYKKSQLPASALTNSTYEESSAFLETVKDNLQSNAFNSANYSLKRFVWASRGVQEWKPGTSASPVDYAFNILEKAAVSRTMFRIVYDVKHKRIYFRTKSDPVIRSVDMTRFDFSCKSPVKILDISVHGKGDMTGSFSGYSFRANYNLLKNSFRETRFLMNTPDYVIRQRARYPETLNCF
jgi:choloylglycine hydrolase